MLCHVLMLILLLFLLLTCCADCGVSERPAAYPFLRYCCAVGWWSWHLFLRCFALHRQRGSAPASLVAGHNREGLLVFIGRRKYRRILDASCAEADVRVRIRGRIVAVHRQRGQVRVVSVVAAAETTNRRISAAALSFCHRTQPHHLTGTPIPLCALVGGMDFCFNDVAPHLRTMPTKCRLGFTRRKKTEATPPSG